jgi:hypothetical protein
MNVFISYTLRDEIVTTEYLKEVSKIVAEFGKPFVDIIDNKADDKQSFVIEQLDKSDLVVLITTKSILMSQWVITEINRAEKNNTPIIRIPLNINQEASLEHLKASFPVEVQKLISRLKGQKTVGSCSFVANFSQPIFAS